jgi:hypothetical protein
VCYLIVDLNGVRARAKVDEVVLSFVDADCGSSVDERILALDLRECLVLVSFAKLLVRLELIHSLSTLSKPSPLFIYLRELRLKNFPSRCP